MKKKTVLIVEDEAIVAADLAGKLGQLGFEVAGICGRGDEAVESACRLQPGIVLMDIRLQGPMDGIEAAEAIRSRIDVPVIYLTAHSDAATLQRAKVSEPFGYILKPFEERELATTIEMALYKHQSESERRRAQEATQKALVELEARTVELQEEVLERKKAVEALRATSARLDLLAETAAALLRTDSPQRLVDSLCNRVMSFLDCDVFFNFLVDDAGGRMHLNACAGIPEDETKKIEWLDYGVAVCGCAARDACRIVAEDIPATPDPRTELVKSYGVKAYACHPLMVEERVLGTLSFGTRTRTRFTADDLSLMKAVADQVAVAMEKIRNQEELLKAREAAETANRAKGQFLANMSHELRTPMNGCLGMIQLALAGHLEEEQREFLEMAEHAATSLLRVINDILDFSKMEAGRFSIEEAPFSLHKCVTETLEIFSFDARQKGITCTLSIADDVPERVIGDPVRLQQVLVNLVGNAVKFTAQGEVRVSVRHGEVQPDRTPEIMFDIMDTGIGIPDEKKHLLFNSFSQVDDTNTRSYGGTGLGLAISKRLVELMGGMISVESTEGTGSTFSFTIPFRPAEIGACASEGEERKTAGIETWTSEDGKKVRILVAEDDPVAGKFLQSALDFYGFQMDLAQTGEDALRMWEQGEYDLIIMDIQMPRMDGLTATRLIREKEKATGRHIQILAMTAHAYREDEELCLSAGMDAYLTKPLDLEKGIDVITSLLKKGTETAPRRVAGSATLGSMC